MRRYSGSHLQQGYRSMFNRPFSRLVCVLALACCTIPTVFGQSDWRIGTKVAPPFAMKDTDDQWSGISIDLMNLVARELDTRIIWQEADLASLIDDVESGQLDASIAALSITTARESRIDFSHQYFGSGLAIVTPQKFQPGWKNAIKALVSPQFLATILLLCGVLSFVGIVIWLLESRRNRAQFGDSPVRGIGSGFWFAAVTMTTVGYGDKAPITFAGRMVSVIWMFAALILTAFLTAQLTTILTAQQVENVVQDVSDLPTARVGNLLHSSSTDYFQDNGIAVKGYASIEQGLQAVAANELDAFVHDQPLLQWMLGSNNQQLQLLPHLFEPQGYAIAVAQDSELREDINIALLKILSSTDWARLKQRYLGN